MFLHVDRQLPTHLQICHLLIDSLQPPEPYLENSLPTKEYDVSNLGALTETLGPGLGALTEALEPHQDVTYLLRDALPDQKLALPEEE